MNRQIKMRRLIKKSKAISVLNKDPDAGVLAKIELFCLKLVVPS